MRQYRFEIILGMVFLVLLVALCVKMSPDGKLSQIEVDTYVARLEQGLKMPEPDRSEFIARARAWGEADDGQPVYLANLIRYNEQVPDSWQGVPIEVTDARAAHGVYLKAVIPMVLQRGVYPVIGTDLQGMGSAQKTNLSGYDPQFDGWSEFNINRYPSRRALISLLSDPVYLKVLPYKFAAMTLVNAPTSLRVLIPDPRLLLGGLLLIVFSLVGWVRSARRSRS